MPIIPIVRWVRILGEGWPTAAVSSHHVCQESRTGSHHPRLEDVLHRGVAQHVADKNDDRSVQAVLRPGQDHRYIYEEDWQPLPVPQPLQARCAKGCQSLLVTGPLTLEQADDAAVLVQIDLHVHRL